MSTAPWYYNSTAPSLKHQYLSKYKPQQPTPSIHAPNKVVVSSQRSEYVKGACENCGSLTHKAKECLERPRKRAARYGGEVSGKDEYVQQQELDYDGKRDRWKGYDAAEYRKVIERYDKAELERKKQRLKELEAAYQLDQTTREHKEREQADAERKEGAESSSADAAAASADASGEAAKADGEAGSEAGKASAASSDVKESDLDKLKRIKQEKRLHKLRKKIAQAAAAAQSASPSSALLPPPSPSSSDSDDSGSSDGEGGVGAGAEYRDYGEVITKVDTKNRVTVRNLRIREDTAKYLRNLDLSSAHYDPKTRSMRQNPHPDKRPDEVLYAGDNFVRSSGDVKEIAQMRKYVWDHAERLEALGSTGSDSASAQAEMVEIHAVALPSAAEKLYQAHKAAAEQTKAATKQRILQTYGGEEHLSRPAPALLQTTEAYVEYDDSGRVLKGAERAQARSKYAEDVLEDGHKAVWGSWWDRKDAKWGYACCQATLRHCICVGDVGKQMKDEMERERSKREAKRDTVDSVGEKRRRAEDEGEEQKVSSAGSSGYSRYARPPSDAELNDFHRSQRRMDDPLNSASFADAV